MRKIKRNNQSGFTIVELLVTVFIFSLIATITTAILVRAMGIQRDSFSIQVIQENSLAVLELMAKEIRVGTIVSSNSACTANTLDITIYPPGSSTATAVSYRLNTTLGIIERVYGGVTYQISSNDVIFNSLIFCISNTGIDDMPSRVTVVISVSNRNGKVVTANLQTTITPRDISAEFQN